MSVEIIVDVDGREVLMDIEPNNVEGLRSEFNELCEEDEALRRRRLTHAPTFTMPSDSGFKEVKRRYTFSDGERVTIFWTSLQPPAEHPKPVAASSSNKENEIPSTPGRKRHNSVSDLEDFDLSDADSEDYGLVEEYFQEHEWKAMTKYMKQRQKNMFELHEKQVALGLTKAPFKPDVIIPSPDASERSLKRLKSSLHSNEVESSAGTDTRPKGPKSNRAIQVPVRQETEEPGPSAGVKSKTDMEKMKKDLPIYDIPKILSEIAEEGSDQIQEICETLKEKGILTGKSRRTFIRILTRHLHFEIASSPRHVTPDMKEGLAKSIVLHYPNFRDPDCDGKTSYPWKSLFDRSGNGWIANAARPIQRKYRTKKSKSRRASKTVELEQEEEDIDDVVQALALLMPGRAEKSQILDGMRDTFHVREEARLNQKTMAEILRRFPHLANYEGEVLQEEFKRLRPNAADMGLNFQKVTPQILSLQRSAGVAPPFEDDTLKALGIMAKMLPRDIRRRGDSKQHSCSPDFGDIVEVIQLGEDIDQHMAKKMLASDTRIQPYLVMVKSPVRNAIVRCFLVLDQKPVQLPTTTSVKCLEFLLKSFFVFNVQYPLGWRSTFHCLATCFARIFENRGPRGKADAITPSERDFLNSIAGQEK